MNRESVLAVVNMFNPAGVSCTAVAACLNVQLHVYSLYSIPQFFKIISMIYYFTFSPPEPTKFTVSGQFLQHHIDVNSGHLRQMK